MGMKGVAERAPRPAKVTEPFIILAGIQKTYRMGRLDYPALRGIDLEIGAGELVAIVGPSGSGKTTILNLVTGIDRPTAGTVTVGGRRIDTMSEEELAVWRGEHVGVVFQFFQLLPTLSALENAVLPLDFARRGRSGSGSTTPAATWPWSAWATRPTTCRRSCPAVSSSGSRSHGRWPPIRS